MINPTISCTSKKLTNKKFLINKKFSRKIISLTFIVLLLLCPIFLNAKNIELTAEKFINLVKENSPAIAIDSIDPLIQEAISVENTKQAYNAPLTARYGQNYRLGDIGNNLMNFGVNWSYLFGPANTKVEVGTSFNGGEIRSTNPITGAETTSTSYNSIIELGVTQPLLFGGLLFLSGQRQVDIQKYAAKISRSAYNTKLAGNLQQALSVYYSYLVQQEMLELSRLSLKESKEILAFNEKKANRSTLDRKDLLANRALVLQNEIEVASTTKSLEALKDSLLNFLGYSNSEVAQHNLILKDSLSVKKNNFTFEETYNNALLSRSELTTLKQQLAAVENALKIGKASLFPVLNASFKFQMLGADEEIGTAYSSTFDEINDNINLEWGLDFLMYTDILSYKVTTARSNLQKVQILKQIAQLKEQIAIEIKQSIRNLETLYNDVKRRERVRAIQRERFNIAKRDYFNGKIDFSQNKNIQIELTTAQIGYLSTKLQYLNALTAHQAADGSLTTNFSVNTINVEEKISLKKGIEFVKNNKEN